MPWLIPCELDVAMKTSSWEMHTHLLDGVVSPGKSPRGSYGHVMIFWDILPQKNGSSKDLVQETAALQAAMDRLVLCFSLRRQLYPKRVATQGTQGTLGTDIRRSGTSAEAAQARGQRPLIAGVTAGR